MKRFKNWFFQLMVEKRIISKVIIFKWKHLALDLETGIKLEKFE